MTSIIVSNTPPFGAMSNQMVADALKLTKKLLALLLLSQGRLVDSAARLASEYEGGSTQFGVVASATPGAQGAAFAYALNSLATILGNILGGKRRIYRSPR